MPGGIGILRSTHGLCKITGMVTGGKKSSRKRPRCESFQAKPSFCRHIKWCISSCSDSQRNSLECALSIMSRCISVYRPVAMNGGGVGVRVGKDVRGLPMIFRVMRYFSERSASDRTNFESNRFILALGGEGQNLFGRRGRGFNGVQKCSVG